MPSLPPLRVRIIESLWARFAGSTRSFDLNVFLWVGEFAVFEDDALKLRASRIIALA